MGRTGRIRFAVKVHQGGSTATNCCTTVGSMHTPGPAFRKVCEVIQQWAASEGAITPGTTVSIVDTNDGGNLFVAEYLGYEVNLLGRDPKAWPGPKHKQSHPLRKWPR